MLSLVLAWGKQNGSIGIMAQMPVTFNDIRQFYRKESNQTINQSQKDIPDQ